jgi:hypothetical protein
MRKAFQAGERGVGKPPAPFAEFRIGVFQPVEAEQADNRGEGEALEDERRQHHGEGGQNDEVALREIARQGKGGGERCSRPTCRRDRR